MKIFKKIQKAGWGLIATLLLLSACNKLELDPVPIEQPTQETTPTLGTLLASPDFTFLKAAIDRAGLAAAPGSPTLLQQLSNPNQYFTVFAPDNNAFIASGIPSIAVINSLPVPQVFAIASYHIIPQVIKAAAIPSTFPNYQYPTILNPAPTLSALLRLTTFPSIRSNGAWVNNIPIIAVDIPAVNGVVHKVARLIAPPSTYLWDKIDTDPDLTILRAAILRADTDPATPGVLKGALLNIGANLTLFAPTNQAMRNFISFATGGQIPNKDYVSAVGVTSAGNIVTVASTAGLIPGLPVVVTAGVGQFDIGTVVASITSATTFTVSKVPLTALSGGTTVVTGFVDPVIIGFISLSPALTTQQVKGIVVYHLLSSQSGTFAPPGVRVFSVNLPSTPTAVKTLLNSAVAVHPGVTVKATFVSPFPGVSVVAAGTVKGAANPTPSNILVGQTTSDLHYLNGVIHKIDQVLLPQ